MNGYEFRKRKPIRGFRYRANKTITPLKCTLYVQMKPLWKLMRVMGLLPYVEVPETGIIYENFFNGQNILLWLIFF